MVNGAVAKGPLGAAMRADDANGTSSVLTYLDKVAPEGGDDESKTNERGEAIDDEWSEWYWMSKLNCWKIREESIVIN